MGMSWARCKVCGKRFEAGFDPRESPRITDAEWDCIYHLVQAHPEKRGDLVDDYGEAVVMQAEKDVAARRSRR